VVFAYSLIEAVLFMDSGNWEVIPVAYSLIEVASMDYGKFGR
jgi:hypothetical protein